MIPPLFRILLIAFGVWGAIPYYIDAARAKDSLALRQLRHNLFWAAIHTLVAALGVVGHVR